MDSLKEYRLRQNLTHREMAAKVGIDYQRYSRIEAGLAMPDSDEQRRIQLEMEREDETNTDRSIQG